MDFAPHVKSSVDIVSVVGEYVRLKKQGATRYVGLCPFHSEKTPSFSVHSGLQIYKCFGCGKAGDVFNFLMEMEGLSFFEALKTLAEQHGIPMPKRGPAEMADREARLRGALYHLHEVAQRLFQASLHGPEGAPARAYLDKRSLPLEAAAEFGVGFAPGGDRLARALAREGASSEDLESSGLVIKRDDGSGYFDRFRNRLIFPIHGESGKLIAFAGRALEAEQQPKYLNSPESAIYKKSYTLYNLHRARQAMHQKERVVLVEGYLDAIGAWRAGVREVVASCGTSLTNEQVRMIGRHARAVTVNFDPDAAGGNAAERSIHMLLDEGLHVRVLSLPDGLDPDEFCIRHGAERYEGLLAGAPGYYFWLADRARRHHDTRTAEGRVAAFQSLLPAINRVRDKIERVALVNDLADRLGVPAGLVLENFRKAAAERREPDAAPASVVSRLKPAERLLLRLLIESEEARQEILGELRPSPAAEIFEASKIFEALFTVAAAGSPFDVTALLARLEEADRRLVTEIVLAEAAAPVDVEQGRAAIRALHAAAAQAQLKDLHRQIQEAEKAGDHGEAIRLLHEKQRLTAQQRSRGAA